MTLALSTLPPPRDARVHPDVLVLRAFWSPQARTPSATRIATCSTVYAPQCTTKGCRSRVFTAKQVIGAGQNRRRLEVPVPVCAYCGAAWDAAEVFEHVKAGARPAPRSTEERLFGERDIGEWLQLHRIATRLERCSASRWPARAYFAYVRHFQQMRGRSGIRVLAYEAAREWPRAPFPWTRYRAGALVRQGREAWSSRLVRAGVIEEGQWWLTSDESEISA